MDTAKLQLINACAELSKHLHAYRQIKNQHNTHLDNLLMNQTSVIHNLGGLDNIIQHCLEDSSYVSTNLNDGNLSILKELLIISDCENNIHVQLSNDKQKQMQHKQQHRQQMVKSKTSTVDVAKYRFTPTIVTVDISDNFYFRNLSYKIASFLYYKIACHTR